MKKCTACKTEKPYEEFYKHASRKDGYCNECKQCNKDYVVKWRTRPDVRAKEQARGKSPSRIAQRNAREETPIGRAKALLMSAKGNAGRFGVPFGLDLSDIEPTLTSGVCPITGLPFDMTRGAGKRLPFAPSIDREVPEKGYVKGNIRVCLWCYNAARGDWGDAVLKELVTALASKYGNSNQQNN